MPTINKALETLVTKYMDDVVEELDQRWNGWQLDLSENTVHEVIGALLARQATLAINFALSPGNWTVHLAPLALRAMADVHITLAWILRMPQERTRLFVQHGLGQAKLELEHRRAQLAADGKDPNADELCQLVDSWISAQRYTHLLEVDLGSWSAMPVRKMADQASLIDFYNYVYAPFSACVHSTWQHVGRLNLQPCFSPLHGGHHIPLLPNFDLDRHYLYLAAKYLDKSFVLFDEKVKPQCPKSTAYNELCQALDELISAETNDQE